ncbi:DnaJ C-terminal domain-containing protein [Streptomyces acidicola]|uniref:DnaJ C-terminal domain-containing protein n=1 Tax=Streptomyces acidicola TaxID=2596892 RepID=UPI00382D98F0
MTRHKSCPACATRADAQGSDGCATCEGTGRVIRDQGSKQVRIPAGIRAGQKVRIKEHGVPGKHGGVPGDMYVTVHITD